ncbi:hypothetical protein ACIF8T_31455 [Streptomyces sp. NPDC085946]|uniref:hypothetical protein n=1 Tax=Streptomyces sp. NPDC085946 TaxID=3365744 RepID=UPI0037D4D125
MCVSAPGSNTVADPAALRETRRLVTGADTGPESPAVAGGRLWFSPGENGNGGIGSVSVARPEPVADPGVLPGWTGYGRPMLAPSPGAPASSWPVGPRPHRVRRRCTT